MKNNITVLVILLLGIICFSYAEYQYKPLLEDGKKWIYYNTDPLSDETPSFNHVDSIICDTLINELNAKKILYKGENRSSFYYKVEKDGIIYTLDETSMQFIPVLDFNLNLDDKISYYTVVGKDIVNIRGIDRTVLTMSSGENSPISNWFWIEGIGSTKDYYIPEIVRPGLVYIGINECWLNGELLYREGDLESLSGIDKLYNKSNTLSDNDIYNLMGQKVDKPSKGQIYIRGGKKIVW